MKFEEGFEFGTTIKDAFFDQSDKSQINDELIHTAINYNGVLIGAKKVSGTSMASIGVDNFLALYDRVVSIINSIYTDEKDRHIVKLQARKILGLEGPGSRLVNTIDQQRMSLIIAQDTDTKNIVARALIEMVDEGRFNEEQMAVVEDQLGLVLMSIKEDEDIFQMVPSDDDGGACPSM